jgi:hypothetical protein
MQKQSPPIRIGVGDVRYGQRRVVSGIDICGGGHAVLGNASGELFERERENDCGGQIIFSMSHVEHVRSDNRRHSFDFPSYGYNFAGNPRYRKLGATEVLGLGGTMGYPDELSLSVRRANQMFGIRLKCSLLVMGFWPVRRRGANVDTASLLPSDSLGRNAEGSFGFSGL